jgi:hypothetical protein
MESWLDGDPQRCTEIAALINKNCGHIVSTINKKYRRTTRENNRCLWLNMTMDNEALYYLQCIRDAPTAEINPRQMMRTTAIDVSNAVQEITGADADTLYACFDVSHSVLMDMAKFYATGNTAMYTQACDSYRENMLNAADVISKTLMVI